MTAGEKSQIAPLLQAILKKLEDLPIAIASASNQGASLTRIDRERLCELLPAISEAIGSAVFASPDLIEEASRDTVLRAALEKSWPDVTAQKIGKLFARSIGFTTGTYRLERAGKAREGVLWRVLHG